MGDDLNSSSGHVASPRGSISTMVNKMSNAFQTMASKVKRKSLTSDDDGTSIPAAAQARIKGRRWSMLVGKEDESPVDRALSVLQMLIEKSKEQNTIEDLQFIQRVLREDRGDAVVPTSLTSSGFTLENQGVVKQWLNSSFARSAGGAVQLRRLPPPSSLLSDANNHVHDPSRFPCAVEKDREQALMECLKKIDDWDFDLFLLDELSDRRPLQFITWHIFKQRGFFEQFAIKEDKLKAFLRELESRYHQNPYHNALHAADIVQTTHALLTYGISQYLSELAVFAMILSAAVHDVEHNGRNNLFHIATMSEHALLHNDISVLENHHCCVCFSLLSTPAFSFLEEMPAETFKQFRAMVVQMILGTDMTYHFEHVNNLKSIVGKNGIDPENWKEDDVAKVRRFALHTADISNPAKPFSVARQWTDRCLNEFWQQGDDEKKLGLKVSPMCDRDTCSVPDSQIGFIKFVVAPTFEVLGMILPGDKLDGINDVLSQNLKKWEAMKAEIELEKLEAEEKRKEEEDKRKKEEEEKNEEEEKGEEEKEEKEKGEEEKGEEEKVQQQQEQEPEVQQEENQHD